MIYDIGSDCCPCCRAHQLQNCGCSWEEIEKAEKKLKELKKLPNKTVSFREFFGLSEDE